MENPKTIFAEVSFTPEELINTLENHGYWDGTSPKSADMIDEAVCAGYVHRYSLCGAVITPKGKEWITNYKNK